jgi:hypothetical protein
MTDTVSMLIAIAIAVVSSAAIASLMDARQSDWSPSRIAGIAGLPLPVLVFVGWIGFLIYDVIAGTDEYCGGENCSWALLATLAVLVVATFLWIVGFVAAVLAVMARR